MPVKVMVGANIIHWATSRIQTYMPDGDHTGAEGPGTCFLQAEGNATHRGGATHACCGASSHKYYVVQVEAAV